jgi:hypothetical protein
MSRRAEAEDKVKAWQAAMAARVEPKLRRF